MRLSRDPDSYAGLGCIVAILILGLGVPIAALFVNPRTVLLSVPVGAGIGLVLHLLSRAGLWERTLTYRVDLRTGRRTLVDTSPWRFVEDVFTSEIAQVTGGSIALAVLVASIVVLWGSPLAKWVIIAGIALGGGVCVYTVWDVTRR